MQYIQQPGDPQGRPPYLGRGVLMQAGLLTANATKLDALVNHTLGQVDPALRFQAVGDKVLFAALYADRMSSDHPEDRQFGSVPEIDIGLWVLTWGGRDGRNSLRWMPAFIFVDSATAMMTGRELYGYPKHFGRMIRRSVGDGDFAVSLRATAFQKRDPHEIGREREILRIERASGAGAGEHDTGLPKVLGLLRQRVDPSGEWAADIETLAPPFIGMPMVFLRQMRDVTAADQVQAREIASTTVAPTTIRGGGFAGDHQLVLAPQATFAIGQTLGCPAAIPLELPFWTRFDFRVDRGVRL